MTPTVTPELARDAMASLAPCRPVPKATLSIGFDLSYISPSCIGARMYVNNCGKRCVRSGISHWVHLYHTDRAAYMSWAVEEWDCKLYLETLGIVPLSMLKDRRGGETNNLYLLDLKKRIDAGKQPVMELTELEKKDIELLNERGAHERTVRARDYAGPVASDCK